MTPLVVAMTIGNLRLTLAGISQWGFWLGAGLVAVVLIVILYRYERAIMSRRMGLMLLSLRVLATLALVAALFEPIGSRTIRETIRGRVILGVDLSDSMRTADVRSAETRLQLARMPEASAEDMSILPSRSEIARRLVSGTWVAPIAEAHDVEALGFARGPQGDGTLASLKSLVGRPAAPTDRETLVTDWTSVLDRALQDEGRPVVGVVLLTDGLANTADSGLAAADKLAARGIPIYPVMIGSTNRPTDAAIAGIKAPDRVTKGDVADVEVTLKIDGPPAGTEVAVILDRPGASPLRKIVQVPGDGSRPVVVFRVNLDAVGLQTMTASIGPIDGDVLPQNDRRPVAIEVTDDRARVLVIDSQARWEFQYLRNALVRDPHVEVESVVVHQPSLPGADPLYKTKLPAKREGTTEDARADPLGLFDVVMIGDVAASDLSDDDWRRILWYVDVRGGTLVLAAGPNQVAAIAQNATLRRLAPVLDPRVVPRDAMKTDPARPALPAGFALSPHDAAAEAFPMLRIDADPVRNRAIWSSLPRLPWGMAGKTKPLASAIATIDGVPEPANVAIASHPYGLGKVLWVGTDGTWRWRYRVGDLHHHRFWGQIIRWANAPKLAVGNAFVRFGPTRPGVAEGSRSTIRAQFREDAPGVTSDLLVAARIFRRDADGKAASKASAVVPLRPRADQPRTFEADAPPLPQGSYLIRLDVPQMADIAPKMDAHLDVFARMTSELVDLAASPDALQRLAATTGGKVFADVDAEQVSALLQAKTIERVRTEETSLWDRPWGLVLFFAVMTAEWILRKRAGLP